MSSKPEQSSLIHSAIRIAISQDRTPPLDIRMRVAAAAVGHLAHRSCNHWIWEALPSLNTDEISSDLSKRMGACRSGPDISARN